MTRRTIDKQPEVILNEAAIAADKANGNYVCLNKTLFSSKWSVQQQAFIL